MPSSRTSEPSALSADDVITPVGTRHPAGVLRVFTVVAALVLVATIPYLLPGSWVDAAGLKRASVDRLKVWTGSTRPPFARLLEFRPPTRPQIAGVNERARPFLADSTLEGAPLPAATGAKPVGATSAVDDPLRVSPDEYARMTRAIEGPPAAMHHFYERLRAVAAKEPGALARVLVYSDSSNGSDRLTSSLRALYQRRFGDGGKGWVPIAPGWQYQRHQDVVWEPSRQWNVSVVNRGEQESGLYGLGGVLAVNRNEAARVLYATVPSREIGSAVSRFRLFYRGWPQGGRIRLKVDDGNPQTISLATKASQDLVHEVHVPDGPHRFEVRASEGTAHLYGAVLEREGPGVVVDGLMLVGAFTRVLLKFNADHWKRQIALREPDLIVFWLGGNDATSRSIPFQRSRFLEEFPEVIRRARSGRPEASCLVMAVLDSAEKVKGVVRSRPRVPRVVQAQEEAAQRAGCAFWNGYEAIGGEGTMWRWFRTRPRLVTVDYQHLTPKGAQVVATLLYQATLRGYDEYLWQRGQ